MTIDVVVAFLEVAQLNFPLKLEKEQSPLKKWHWSPALYLSDSVITNQEPGVRSYGCMYLLTDSLKQPRSLEPARCLDR